MPFDCRSPPNWGVVSSTTLEMPLPPLLTVAKLKAPLPSVCKTWLALPSAVGKVYAPFTSYVPITLAPVVVVSNFLTFAS